MSQGPLTASDTDLVVTADDPPAVTPEFRSDVTVELVRSSARDADVLFAARVSTQGEQTLEALDADPARSRGLINYLMRDRHGTPFEHNSMTFYVQAPIFVFREFMRHRIASYNEESRPLPGAAAGLLRPRARAQALPGGQARATTSSSRARRTSTTLVVEPRPGGCARRRTRPTSGCSPPGSPARWPGSCCR